jgi:signal transduction histidine kinase
MSNQNLSIEELQKKVTMLERANAALISKNIYSEKALQDLEESIAEYIDADAFHELIDDISHDLRLPLSTMTTYVYLLKHDSDPEYTQGYLDILEKQLMYLTDVVNNLINMVRLDMDITHFELHPLQVNDILMDVIESLAPVANQKNQSISTDFDSDLPAVLIDRVKITRALINVVLNAITYTPEQGEIRLRATTDDTGFVLIEISDIGIGIAEKNLARIFDRFFRVNKAQTAGGNSGLGLAITKRIIDNHRGRIEVESELNKGTLFRIYLPTLSSLISTSPE